MRALLRFLGVISMCATAAMAQDAGPCISVPDPNGPGEDDPSTIVAPSYSFPDTGGSHIIWGGGPPVHDVCGVNRYQVNTADGVDTITSVSVQWYDNAAIGQPGRIAIWQASGGVFTNANLVHVQNVTVQSNTLGTYNTYQLSVPVTVYGAFYVGFSTSTDPVFTAFFLPGRPALNYVRGTSFFIEGPAGMNLADLPALDVQDVADASSFGASHFLIRANAGSSGYTYQGELKSAGNAYTGSADMRFQHFRTPTGATAMDANPVEISGINVVDGKFTVNIPADPRVFVDVTTDTYLEVSVRTSLGGPYTTLSPRQRMTSTPTAFAATYANTVGSVPWTAMTGAPDLNGRLQIRGANTGETPGTWLSSPSNNPVQRAFIGMQNENNVGFYGPSIGWGLTMNTQTGYVGLGTQTPITGASKFDINTNAASGGYGGMYMVAQPGGWPFYGFNTGTGASWMYYRGTDNTWRVYNAGEQLVLTSGGLLSVGTGVASSAGYRLELPNNAGPSGQGRANAWVTYSSREYKDNIKTLENPLDTIDRLRGVTFDWRNQNADGSQTHDIGFIAEEIADVLPQLVTRTADGKATGLDYGRVVPVAVEAIKAQRKEIADLKARLDAIEAAMSKLQK